jgi:hypothetical protein
MSQSRLQRIAKGLELPVALLALLVIPALVLEERAFRPGAHTIGVALNWIVWLAFCVEFGIRWSADRTLSFPRRAWFDLLLIGPRVRRCRDRSSPCPGSFQPA